MDSLGTKSDEEVSFSRREDGAQARPSFFFCPPLVLGKQKMQVIAQLAGLLPVFVPRRAPWDGW
jgi:hypothetical protein